jgi:hypothetical protein
MMPVENSGICRMCSMTAPLGAGHVVPALVYRWLKETAALPFLRAGENPNLRVQDGWKRHWFCRACEDQMGRFEKAFAEELFPLVVSEKPAPYRHGPWLSRFIASVAWRTLMLHGERGESFDFFSPEQKVLVPKALEHWRAFVHDEAGTPGIHEVHFSPMGMLADYQGDRTLPPNFNRYLMRTIEIDVAARPSEAFVYVKMGPAVALGFIQPPPSDTWAGTAVSLGDGQVGGEMAAPIQFLDYLIERAEKVRALMRARSVRQIERVRESLLANPDRAAASETFRAMQADVERFGVERVFPADDAPETDAG